MGGRRSAGRPGDRGALAAPRESHEKRHGEIDRARDSDRCDQQRSARYRPVSDVRSDEQLGHSDGWVDGHPGEQGSAVN